MKLRLVLTTCCLFLVFLACAVQNEGLAAAASPATAGSTESSDPSEDPVSSLTPAQFPLATSCISCHDNIQATDDSTYSLVKDWQQSVHAQSALDPLFLAVARSETMIHPDASEAIQGVCAACHLPMADFNAQSLDVSQAFLDNSALSNNEFYALYAEGDSCMICHQLTLKDIPDNVSFRGSELSIDLSQAEPGDLRSLYSYFSLNENGQSLMKKVLGYTSVREQAMRKDSTCIPCHTLYTDSFTVEGEPTGIQLPEQVTELEWSNSGYWDQPCISCHMPLITDYGALSNREIADAVHGWIYGHTFPGANAYVLRLNDDEDGSLEQGITQTEEFLQTQTAKLSLSGEIDQNVDGSSLLALDVRVNSITGHKFPTGFPSRRAWIHVKVLDEAGKVIYESGAYDDEGKILDNDGDLQKGEFEPHYDVIDQPGQVQIYESVMIDSNGKATTNLLEGVYYGKDNRLLPFSFKKQSAPSDCAVVGDAADDDDFIGGSDTVHYRITLPEGTGEVTIEVELLYQTVGYRFLENLNDYPSDELEALTGLVQQNPNTPSLVASKELLLSR